MKSKFTQADCSGFFLIKEINIHVIQSDYSMQRRVFVCYLIHG